MKLLIGLGNPGEKYKLTRHNVGHMVIARLGNEVPNGVKVFKTSVFMNASGDEVRKLANFHKIKPSSLYIVHDDLDIRLGEYKIQFGVGPKDHNGINDITEKLGTEDFWRVRIGVDNREANSRTPGEDYVLQDFNTSELQIVKEIIAKASEELLEKLTNDAN